MPFDLTKITPRYFLDKAREETGLSDYGNMDFLPAFEHLVVSLKNEANLTDKGWEDMEPRLVRLLANRLRFHNDVKRHPEILAQKLLPALVMVGLPRTGSTKLQRMVASSGTFQELLMWHVYNPAPFADSAGSEIDPRIEDAEKFCQWRATTNPRTSAAHHIAAQQVEEETYLLELTFLSIFPNAWANVPSYDNFIKTLDKAPMYRYLRELLQYLQWQLYQGAEKPWLLKAPHNLGFEKYIHDEMPGSRFVVSHRDPRVCIASTAAIVKQSRLLYSDTLDKHTIGKWVLNTFSEEMERHMAWRQSAPHVQVLDLAYEDIEANGMDVARRVHDFIGVPLTAEAEKSISEWLEENVQHMHGKHEYSLEEYGLSEAEIEEKFSAYMKKYASLI
ncbi:MAG: sulfotransferase [Porticoccaceae bacterium]